MIDTRLFVRSQVVSVCKAVRAFIARVKADLEFDVAATIKISNVLRDLTSSIEAGRVADSQLYAEQVILAFVMV